MHCRQPSNVVSNKIIVTNYKFIPWSPNGKGKYGEANFDWSNYTLWLYCLPIGRLCLINSLLRVVLEDDIMIHNVFSSIYHNNTWQASPSITSSPATCLSLDIVSQCCPLTVSRIRHLNSRSYTAFGEIPVPTPCSVRMRAYCMWRCLAGQKLCFHETFDLRQFQFPVSFVLPLLPPLFAIVPIVLRQSLDLVHH